MRQTDVVLMLHSHLPYVLNHGRWPHGSDWLCEAAIDTYLPLIEVLRRLERDNTAAPVTIGLTPILAAQLNHAAFGHELDAYFAQRLAHCDEAPASLASTNDEHLLPLVAFWRTRLLRLRALFDALDGDLLGEFRRLQDAERLELTTSAATHPYLPLLGRDESIRLQLAVGRDEYRCHFGRLPDGCWLPECGYRPSGWWDPLPGRSAAGERSGLEAFLSQAGYRYCFVDAHMARAGAPLGVYGALFGAAAEHRAADDAGTLDAVHSPYQTYRMTPATAPVPVVALVRDPRASLQVWSRTHGYPGAAAYLEFHKIRWPGGLRLWRVSEPGTALGAKAPYHPGRARAQAYEHARHFAGLLEQVAERSHGDVITIPFDTELFGHWWFEGPDFLSDLYATLPQTHRLRAVTAAEHIDRQAPRLALGLAAGSWGQNGDDTMWNNERVAWMWPEIWRVETAFWNVAPRALARSDLHDVLSQAARSMLLQQASDWPFIVSTGEVGDYAVRRFREHTLDAQSLIRQLERIVDGGDASGAHALAGVLRDRDGVFADLVPSIAAALDAQPWRVVVDPVAVAATWEHSNDGSGI